jgi:hypothetical protein
MAREHGRVNVEIWSDPEFRNLPPAAQHLYLLLWTSPGLTYCGTHDWRPGRLAALSSAWTADHIALVGECLAARYFLVIDDDTEEVLIRSWARFDGLLKQPRMAVSFATAYATVASEKLRAVLVHETKKIQQSQPNLSCWGDKRVASLLAHPDSSAKGLVVPEDPFKDGFGDGFALGLGQTRDGVSPRVCTPPTPSPTPATTPHSSKTASSADADAVIDEDFATWYQTYPRKVGKQGALKAYRRARKVAEADEILDGLWRQLPVLSTAEQRFQPHPATWLNEGRWEDESAAPGSAGPDDRGWAVPWTPPAAPADIADDPAQYAAWLDEQRKAAGR